LNPFVPFVSFVVDSLRAPCWAELALRPYCPRARASPPTPSPHSWRGGTSHKSPPSPRTGRGGPWGGGPEGGRAGDACRIPHPATDYHTNTRWLRSHETFLSIHVHTTHSLHYTPVY